MSFSFSLLNALTGINLKVVKAEKDLGILISSGHDLEGPHRHGGS